MDNNQRFLAKLLSCAIRGKEPGNIDFGDIDWPSVFKEALAHKVVDLLLPAIKKIDGKLRPDDKIMKDWNDITLYSGCRQAIEMENMSHVLNLFNSENIPVISLKGLVLRDLYPQPLLRSMADADILIHREDFDRAKTLLYSLGYYTRTDTNLKEVCFYHKSHLMIELHWLLIEPGYIQNSDLLEQDAWAKCESSLLGSVPILTLSTEEHIIYLCMHMLLHFKYRGFGLRQLCDLVLLIEAKRDQIDWDRFYIKIGTFGIAKFVESIFFVCNRLYDFEIPQNRVNPVSEDADLIDTLIDDIFSSGIFGFKNPSRVFITRTIERFGEEPGMFNSKASLFFRNVFPLRKALAEKYKYVEKSPLLLPIAWVHRLFVSLFSGRFVKDFSLRVNAPDGTKHEYAKRVELFKKLNLR